MKKPHRELTVWQKSVDFIIHVYELTEKFPKSELYSLTSQLRRASISIASNIAEGAARRSPREFLQFLTIARGSISEIGTHLEIVGRLGYALPIQLGPLDAELTELDRMLSGLMRSIRRKGLAEST
jgi:four helix bundle protein